MDGPAPNFFGLKVLWCVFSAVGVAAAYLAFRYGFRRRVALIGAVACVFSFHLQVIAASLNSETPYLALVMLIALGTLRFLDRPGIALGMALGVLHGLANLVRAEHTLLLVLLVLWCLWRWRRALTPGAKTGRVAVLASCAAFLATCLPWSIHATRANVRYNTQTTFRPDWDRAVPPWSADGRAFFESLPAFCKREVAAYLAHEAGLRSLDLVTEAHARRILLDAFGYIPEPVRSFTLVSSQGPLSFAVANHPDAGGGFSRAALIGPFHADGPINLALPPHLRLYNHGWSVGLGFITADPRTWLINVGRKLSNFAGGVEFGLTSFNFAIGRAGERRPIDLLTHAPGSAIAWRLGVAALILTGAIACVAGRRGTIWLIIIASKVAVTVLFYGYARQAVSILPAFALLAAAGVETLVEPLTRDSPRAARRFTVVAFAAALAMLAAETAHFFREDVGVVTGAIRPAPQWGPDAWVSYDRLLIEFRPPAPGATP